MRTQVLALLAVLTILLAGSVFFVLLPETRHAFADPARRLYAEVQQGHHLASGPASASQQMQQIPDAGVDGDDGEDGAAGGDLAAFVRCHCDSSGPADCDVSRPPEAAIANACAVHDAALAKLREYRATAEIRAAARAALRRENLRIDVPGRASDGGGFGALRVKVKHGPPGSFTPSSQVERLMDLRDRLIDAYSNDSAGLFDSLSAAAQAALMPSAIEIEHAEVNTAVQTVVVALALAAAPGVTRPETWGPEDFFYTRQNHQTLRKSDPFEEPRHLPRVAPTMHYRSCAIVGSSGHSLNYNLGKEIDSHDAVWRLNQAPVDIATGADYSEHVGTRTDIRLLNRKWTSVLGRHHDELLDADDANRTVIVTRASTKHFALLKHRMQEKRQGGQLQFLSSRITSESYELLRVVRKALQEVLGASLRGGHAASSGMLAIFLAMRMCDAVYAYGMSLQPCRGTLGCSHAYHYFSGDIVDSSVLRADDAHSFELEGVVARALHGLGLACLRPEPRVGGRCGVGLRRLLGQRGELPRDVGLDALIRAVLPTKP